MPKLKSKCRWFRFSVRWFILVVTLISVFSVAFDRLKEWGEELDRERLSMEIVKLKAEKTVIMHSFYPSLLSQEDRERVQQAAQKIDEFERRYWLPLKVYELTNRRTAQDDDCQSFRRFRTEVFQKMMQRNSTKRSGE